MQDRFKFRVYIKYSEQTFDVDSFWIDNIKEKVIVHFSDGHTKTFKFKDIIIEQCTGLRDKNGKLIYEGDILYVEVIDWKAEESWKAGKVNTYWSVAYKDYENRSGFMVFGKNRRFNKPLTKAVIFNSKASVIGNIHENADLLENKDESM